MPLPTREPGGGALAIGTLFSETFEDLTQNIQGYLMAGLALMAVAFPLGMLVGMGGMIGMYVVMGAGIFASTLGGVALGEATGEQDLAALVGGLGTMGSMFLGFAFFFGVIVVMVGALAPLSASLNRAIAAHQRGEAPLTFQSAFGTIKEDIMANVGVTLVVTSAAFFGVMFCFVGVFVPAFLFAFAAPMVALHRTGVRAALAASARHAMAHPAEHVTYATVHYVAAMIANYVPVLGPMFLMALSVRAYRRMFGDGPAPVLAAA